MSHLVSTAVRLVAVAGLSVAMSGCFTQTLLRDEPYSGIGPGGYTASDANNTPVGIVVEAGAYDVASAPKACVNDLTAYSNHLQVPEVPAVDLSKPVNAYVQEAGSTRGAINQVHVEIASLNVQLEDEVASRNPFDHNARAASDESIAYIEDGILLNEALAEALECRR